MNRGKHTLNDEQLNRLNGLLNELNTGQLIWVSGYVEGILEGAGSEERIPLTEKILEPVALLTILYGTETGNSQELAEKLVEKAVFRNIAATAYSLYDYDFSKLAGENNVAVIVSTHGEGEVPEMAREFHDYITGDQAVPLENVSYSVLALGDKTYKHFCKSGEDIYNGFRNLGAFSIIPLQKCDVDYGQDAEIWMNNFLMNLTPAAAGAVSAAAKEETVAYSKTRPFEAIVKTKAKLTGDGSDKEVYHFELSLEGSGLNYEPGDALGIYTRNPEGLVRKIIETGKFDPQQTVPVKDGQVTLIEALTHHFEITVLSFDLLENYYEQTQNVELDSLLDDDNRLEEYLNGHDLLDLLEDFPYEWNANKLVSILRPIPARLYSIASSQELVGNEVHATVALVRYEKKNRLRLGACTSHIIFNVEEGGTLPVYIDKNPSFKLPENEAAIIMVGAGTGIAPYRAFMQLRDKLGQKAHAWLFYGDRHEKSDFLYREEWEKLLDKGTLERMDVAFSRDQKEKVYVQQKMLENQVEIYKWLENGAHLYICGDMKHMFRDVNKTLLSIIQAQGGVDQEKAELYLRGLKRDKRYQTDVY